jgi:hypothetical protein
LNIFLRITSITFAILFTTSALLFAQSKKERIAVVELRGEISESESAALTDKVLNEILKSDNYLVFERSQMEDILREQGFQQTGCTNTECAIEIGQLLGVKKIVFGNIGKVGKIYSISLKMVNVETGEIEKSTSIESKGTLEDVLKKGIIKAVQALIGTEVITSIPTTEQAGRVSKKRPPAQTIIAIISAAAGVGFGAASGYYWKEKSDYHDKYLAAYSQDQIDNYHEKENEAFTYAGVFTGVSAALIPTSIILFIIRPKGKKQSKASIDTQIGPDAGAVTFTFNF